MLTPRALVAIVGVFIGCFSSIVFLELLVKSDASIGNLVTFSQFAFIAFEGFVFTSKFGSARRIISLKDYTLLVIMFFLTSVCNNYAFNFDIPMPLHMIFRSGSLISNMLMGGLILRRSYKPRQYLAVLMISIGIFICTYHSSTSNKRDNSEQIEFKYHSALGILLLGGALLVSSYMGIYQELLYRRYGKYAREALYYTHLMPLPGFLLLHNDIRAHFVQVISSDTFNIPFLKYFGLEWGIPIILFYLIGNVLTQYLCISSVYTLTTECTSLTVTLILTLRKFISLVFSVIYFRNAFTIYHWLATLLVFTGTFLFADIFKKLSHILKIDKNTQKVD